MAVKFKLSPGQSREVTFVLTWHFPNGEYGFEQANWVHQGNMYANRWGNSLESADYVVENLGRLRVQTKLFHDTLYESNLPYWLLDRLSSQFSVLHSTTCFWAADGYFGLWEGTNRDSGCCFGNCSHVYQYAQLHARLYPSIARKMREQALSYQKDDGNIPNRQPDGSDAIDGQLGEILGLYRENLTSSDNDWIKKQWAGMKKAMEHAIDAWDSDADGVLSGQQGNTLDGSLGGSTSWLGTMYLAALESAETVGMIAGDTEAARRYKRIRESGAKKQNETLWNGEYYIQIPDEKARNDYIDGCHIDQLLGQWWAKQLGLGPYYPLDRRVRALESILKYNFKNDFRSFKFSERKFVDEADAGTVMISWPGDDKAERTIQYGNEVWTGTEYAAAAAMIQHGMLKEGLMLVKAVADRSDGRLRENIQYEGHAGNPFSDDESGKFYGRAMSVWSVLLACQGFIYDGPAGLIGFEPVWQSDDHVSFFSSAEGWGLFSQKRSGEKQVETIEVRYGELAVRELVFELPKGKEIGKATVSVNGAQVQANATVEGQRVRIKLADVMKLRERGVLRVEISY